MLGASAACSGASARDEKVVGVCRRHGRRGSRSKFQEKQLQQEEIEARGGKSCELSSSTCVLYVCLCVCIYRGICHRGRSAYSPTLQSLFVMCVERFWAKGRRIFHCCCCLCRPCQSKKYTGMDVNEGSAWTAALKNTESKISPSHGCAYHESKIRMTCKKNYIKRRWKKWIDHRCHLGLQLWWFLWYQESFGVYRSNNWHVEWTMFLVFFLYKRLKTE